MGFASGARGQIRLVPARSPVASAPILRQVQRLGLRRAEVFARQTFRLERGGRPAGLLVSGRGMQVNARGSEQSTCFVAFVAPGGTVSVVKTIGFDEWEAESCVSVAGVGKVGAAALIAIIYRAGSPNADVSEPVVLSLDDANHRLTIDLQASRWASLAGAATIEGVDRALARTQPVH